MGFRVSRIWPQRTQTESGHRAIAQGHDDHVPDDHRGRAHLARRLEVSLPLPRQRIEADEERLSGPAPEAGDEDAVAVQDRARERARRERGAPGEMAVPAAQGVEDVLVVREEDVPPGYGRDGLDVAPELPARANDARSAACIAIRSRG